MNFIATSSTIPKRAWLNDTMFLSSPTTWLLVKSCSFQLREDKKSGMVQSSVLVGFNHDRASIARIDSNSRTTGNPDATSSGGT
jgi:hypothetical protein